MSKNGNAYLLGANQEEMQRLLNQANVVDRFNYPLLQRYIKSGDTVLELGGGTGNCSEIICRQLHHNGSLTIIEREERYADFIQQRLTTSGYRNFDIRKEDIVQWQDNKQYDVIFGRAILHHISQVLPLLQQLVKKLKPNGLLIFEEPIMNSAYAIPENRYFDKIWSWYIQLGKLNQLDFLLGEKLAQYYRETGISVVEMQSCQAALVKPEEHILMQQVLTVIGDQLLQKKICSEKELVEVKHHMSQAPGNTDIWFYAKLCQVVGRNGENS